MPDEEPYKTSSVDERIAQVSKGKNTSGESVQDPGLRTLLKVLGVGTAIVVGDAVLGGPLSSFAGSLFRPKPVPVETPQVNQTTTTTTTPVQTVEERIREEVSRRVSGFNSQPDIKIAYPRMMAAAVSNNIDLYLRDVDLHAQLLEKHIRLGEKNKHGIPIKFSESGYSNLDVYHANLEASLFSGVLYVYDVKKGESVPLDTTKPIDEQISKNLARNFYNFDDLSEEVGNEVEDPTTFKRLVKQRASQVTRGFDEEELKFTDMLRKIEGKPSLSVIRGKDLAEIYQDQKELVEIGNEAGQVTLKTAEVGTYGEKLVIADRSHTRRNYQHDIGRQITVGRLLTRGMTAYDGIATLPNWNPEEDGYGQYITDGFTASPYTDATKESTGVTTEKTAQSWGTFIHKKILTLLVVGQHVREVSIGTSRGRSVFYKN